MDIRFDNAGVRRQDRLLEECRAEEILRCGEYGFLALGSAEGGYGVPINYVADKDRIYFHCASEGEKLRRIAENPEACFCVAGHTAPQPAQFTTEYESVMTFGKVTVVHDDAERVRAYAATKADTEHTHDSVRPGMTTGLQKPATEVSTHFKSDIGLKVGVFNNTGVINDSMEDVLWINGWRGSGSGSGKCHALHFPRNANEMYMTLQDADANAFGSSKVRFYHSGNIRYANIATTTIPGLMSAPDKVKLNSIDTDSMMKILGAGVVNASGGFSKKKGAVSSVSHSNTGRYMVNHSIGNSNYEAQITCIQSGTIGVYASVKNKASNSFEVYTYEGNTLKDVSFFFQIFEF